MSNTVILFVDELFKLVATVNVPVCGNGTTEASEVLAFHHDSPSEENATQVLGGWLLVVKSQYLL